MRSRTGASAPRRALDPGKDSPACASGSKTRSPFSPRAASAASSSRERASPNWWRAARRRRCRSTRRFDASRHVVLPGLVNAHHHFYQTLTRAHPAGFGKELLAWLVAMERVWARIKPEQLRLAVRMALVELMLSGCTTAADHHNLFPAALENAIDIEVEEALKLGVRMTVTRGSMGLSEKDGGLQPDSIVQDADAILADCERVLKRYHDPSPGAQIRIALAPCSPLAVPRRVLAESAGSPSATTAGCTPISASPPTRTSTPRRPSACARSTSWRRRAG